MSQALRETMDSLRSVTDDVPPSDLHSRLIEILDALEVEIGLMRPFLAVTGMTVLAGCVHPGDEEGAQAVAKVMLMTLGQLGLGENFVLAEHPTQDVVYVGVPEVPIEPRPELLVPEKVLLIPGQRPISGGGLVLP